MIEIGVVVKGIVTRIAPFGIFMSHGEDLVFVPLSNFAWIPNPKVISQFYIGQERDVLVERLNYDKNIYTGSFRRLDPEGNPYRILSRYPPSATFDGIVVMVHANGFTIEIDGGCRGEIFKTPQNEDLTKGEKVRVRIKSLEVDVQNLVFELVSRTTVPPENLVGGDGDPE